MKFEEDFKAELLAWDGTPIEQAMQVFKNENNKPITKKTMDIQVVGVSLLKLGSILGVTIAMFNEMDESYLRPVVGTKENNVK